MNAPIARLSASTRSGTMSTSTTGFPWSDGDMLYAADLNAAFNMAGVGNFLPISGGQLTGPLYLYSNPTVGTGAATKQYVDTAIGGTLAAPGAANIGRNLLHNPLFNVAQRGAGAWSAGPVYTLDRWQLTAFNDAASVNQQPLSDSQRAAIGDEAAAVCLYNVFTGNAAAGAYTVIQQKMEGVRRFGNKTATVSFWAFAASGTPKLGVSIDQFFGNGGSPSAAVFGAGVAVTLSGTATRYSLTFTIPTTSGKTLGTSGDDWTGLSIWYSSGVTNAFRAGSIGVQAASIALWGVQLEIGGVATPLEKPDPRYDLANCQRFYQTSAATVYGYSSAGGQYGYFLPFPTVMRASPTIVFYVPSYVNASGMAANAPAPSGYNFYVLATAAGALIASANFTASADL